MAWFDLPESELWDYQGVNVEPHDFDQFWEQTLLESRSMGDEVTVTPVTTALTQIDVFDVVFPGFGGHPIRGWLRLPRDRSEPLPVLVQYHGYGSGRGHAMENSLWASAGYAHFDMDNRGQGSAGTPGQTPDPVGVGPQYAGYLTRGIESRETYFYRRLYTDAARAVDAVRQLPEIDPERVVVMGGSQGGGMALAAAALVPDVLALFSNVTFGSDFRRAMVITDEAPWSELVAYLGAHTGAVESVYHVLSYFDGVSFARRAQCPAWFTSGLMDTTCPPSTVFAAHNNYAGPKHMTVWPYNGHEGGRFLDDVRTLERLSELTSR